MNNRRLKIQVIFEFIIDFLMLSLSNLIAYPICDYLHKLPNVDKYSLFFYVISLLVAYIAVSFLFTTSMNLYIQNRKIESITAFKNCALIYMTFAVILILTKNKMINSRFLFVLSFILFFAFSLIGRYILKRVLIYKFSKSKMATLAGVITVSDKADKFVKSLATDWSRNIVGIALLDKEKEDLENCNQVINSKNSNKTTVIEKNEKLNSIQNVPILAYGDDIIDWVKRESLDEVFIILPSKYSKIAQELVEEFESMGIIVHINISTVENMVKKNHYKHLKCEVYASHPIATVSASTQSTRFLVAKRLMDILGALAGLLISVPVIALVAIPLLIESPGPLFFKQQRVGKNGRLFNIYKLRSMYVDAEERKAELMKQNKMDGLMFKMDDDPRITKVGKFIRKTSIDELPQFWNVLKGDMSLVGTRPPTIDEFNQYESHHKRRLSMKPGITGMWQVSGRSDITDFEEIVNLDCEYIDNCSIWLDIKILFKTVAVVFMHKGAE